MELKNIKEYNPEYNKDGTLVWKKIGEKTSKNGKHIRKKKQYPQISIDKIKVGNYNVSEKILAKSRSLYWKTKEMIPVYLSYDFKLIGGFEQFEIAKELKLKSIPFLRNNKMNQKERKQFTNSVQNIKIGNKKYPVKAIDGSTIYVSMNHAKKVREAKRMAAKLKCYIRVLPNFTFSLIDKNDNYILGNADKGLKLNVIRKKMKPLLMNIKSK